VTCRIRLTVSTTSRRTGTRRRSARGCDDRRLAYFQAVAPHPLSSSITAALIIATPLALALICFAARLHIIELSHVVRAELLFALLLALMTTGMPISIALGLSVLTYLFILSDVDPKMVGLKLFTSIDRFEIMAIPFFILAGNFLTTGGVARRMIAFAASLIGHWYGGLGLAGVVACALFAAISGSSVATVVGIGSIILPALLQKGYPPRFGAGVIATSGALGILFPPSINLVIYAVATSGMQPRGPDRRRRRFRLGRPAFHRRAGARADSRHHARRHDLVSRLAQRLSAHGAGELARMLARFSRKHLGVVADSPGARRHLFGPVHADRSRRRGCRLCLHHRGVRLQGTEVLRGAGRAAQSGVDERDDPLHHHQCGGVLLAADLGADSPIHGRMDDRARLRHGGFLLVTNIVLLAAGNFMDPAAIVLIMAPILFPMGAALGVNPVHLGILMAVNMEVGLCHPPVGLNLYVASGITGMGITELTVAVLPWLATMLIFLVMVTYIPALSLWLPHLLGML
jgi:C4-dicarboxylate transporter DctM subunit